VDGQQYRCLFYSNEYGSTIFWGGGVVIHCARPSRMDLFIHYQLVSSVNICF